MNEPLDGEEGDWLSTVEFLRALKSDRDWISNCRNASAATRKLQSAESGKAKQKLCRTLRHCVTELEYFAPETLYGVYEGLVLLQEVAASREKDPESFAGSIKTDRLTGRLKEAMLDLLGERISNEEVAWRVLHDSLPPLAPMTND